MQVHFDYILNPPAGDVRVFHADGVLRELFDMLHYKETRDGTMVPYRDFVKIWRLLGHDIKEIE